MAIAFALMVWIPTARGLLLERQTPAFAETTGRVVLSELKYVRGRHGTWQVRVEAAYAVDGTEYRAVVFQPFSEPYRARHKQDAEQVAARYAVGATVPVYYDAGDPARSVLRRERNHKAWILLLISGVSAPMFTLAGVGLLVRLARALRRWAA
jgi:hypothetical protein